MQKIYSSCFAFFMFCLVFHCQADNGAEITTGELNMLGRDKEQFLDRRVFSSGAIVNVYLNYDSFVTEEFPGAFPTFTRKNLEASVRMATERWSQLGGMNLKLRYVGTTTRQDPGRGEILVKGFRESPYDTAVGDAVHWDSRCTIRLFRQFKRGARGFEYINWAGVFVYQDYPREHIFAHDVMVHEMGHCLGLGHNGYITGNTFSKGKYASVMTANSTNVHHSFGPFIQDIEDLQALYGVAPNISLDVLVSKDGGQNWGYNSNNLSGINTTSKIPVVVNRDSDRMVMFYQTRLGRPALLHGSSDGKTWNNSKNYVMTTNDSIYGVSGSGYNNEYMMAWVDPNDEHRVKLRYSNDGGEVWRPWGNLNIRAGSRPAIHKVTANRWILSYVHLDDNPWASENGRIYTRISNNDGGTWSGPQYYSDLRGLGNITIASQSKDNIRIGFVQAWDARDTWTSAVTTISANVGGSNGNSLFLNGWNTHSNHIADGEVSYAATMNEFVTAYRALTRTTTSCNMSFNSALWGNCKTAINYFSDFQPTITARPKAAWAFMFKQR